MKSANLYLTVEAFLQILNGLLVNIWINAFGQAIFGHEQNGSRDSRQQTSGDKRVPFAVHSKPIADGVPKRRDPEINSQAVSR